MSEDENDQGFFLGGEFFANDGKPKRRKFTKEQAMLGIFGDGGSSDDEPRGRGGKKSALAAGPVSFVSKGSIGGDRPQSAVDDDDDEEEENDGSAYPQLDTMRRTRETPRDFSMGGRKKEDSLSFAGMRGQAARQHPTAHVDKDFGKFEKYTKGIGSKLLMKMGYKPGEGLGVDGKGMAAPIEVKLRPKGAGIAYGGFKEANSEAAKAAAAREEAEKRLREQMERDEDAMETEDTTPVVELPQQFGWKKNQQKVKRVYKTVDEVLADNRAKAKDVPLATYTGKVIDMTGPQTREATSISDALSAQQLAQQQSGGASKYLPELQHNVRLLSDLASNQMMNTDRRLRQDQSSLGGLQHQHNQLLAVVNDDAGHIDRLQKLLAVVENIQKGQREGAKIDLDNLSKLFVRLQSDYAEEYQMMQLSDLAVALVFPALRKALESWNPLAQPASGADLVSRWKSVLQQATSSSMQEAGDGFDGRNHTIYAQLIVSIVLPRMRYSLTNEWNPRDFERPIQMLNTWHKFLPLPVWENVLDQLIMPKLAQEVDAWNPRTDPVPIHNWILPWLPIMGGKLELLVPTIRYKLTVALTDWHPADPSAHAVLEPWKKLWDQKSMDELILRHILPKLCVVMREFQINPRAQEIAPLHWVFLWQDLIPENHLIALMEQEFFPKFFHILYTWLTSPAPNYDEVTQWYMGWKQLFPESLSQSERMKAQWIKALDMMNQAATSLTAPNPQAASNIHLLRQAEERAAQMKAMNAATARSGGQPSEPAKMTFKEVLERVASEHGILFAPTDKRHHAAGKQVYLFGSAYIVLDQSLALVYEGGEWNPISVEALVQLGAK